MEKSWQIAEKIPKKIIKEHQDFNHLMLQLLFNRKVFDLKDSFKNRESKIEYFLNPGYEKLHSPLLLKDMNLAVIRIKKAIEKKEKIVIFGDYDADGVTASAILSDSLKFLGAKPEVYIPHRDKEGYGLNPEAVKKLAKQKTKLIITVDCGIINIKEVELAQKLRVDVIVTDHHEPSGSLPKAIAVIDPKRKDSKYPFTELAGVGVAFKLTQALFEDLAPKDGENFLKWLLDLVAVGSIGDIVPLIDENRILVKFGSIVFGKTRRLGLKELKAKSSGSGLRMIDFSISPKLNAAGRMDHANWAFKLLTTESKIESFKLINRIEQLNKERKALTENIVKEAREQIEPILPEEKILIVAKSGWSAAVSGIVASRLVDLYGLPSLVIEKKQQFSKGSARSPKGIDIISFLREASDKFTKLGGHKNAAGFTYKTKDHDAIVVELMEKSEKIKVKNKGRSFYIDSEIEIEDINQDFFSFLKKMEPFGQGNLSPTFLIRGARLMAKKRIGLNHLKLWFTKNGKRREAIGFGKGHLDDDILIGEELDVVFQLSENEYRGIRSIQFEILDIRKINV